MLFGTRLNVSGSGFLIKVHQLCRCMSAELPGRCTRETQLKFLPKGGGLRNGCYIEIPLKEAAINTVKVYGYHRINQEDS